MNGSWQIELEELMSPILDGGQPDDQQRLDRLLGENPDALQAYVALMRVDSILRWQSGRNTAGVPVDDTGIFQLDDPNDIFIQPTSDSLAASMPKVRVSSHSSAPSSFDWLVSYGAAALLVTIALLSAWAYKISRFQAEIATDPPSQVLKDGSVLAFVGRITGMKDCVWSDEGTSAMPGASVPIGREYDLASGLLEITYNSGARVVLEGPCRYTADSHAGGFLRVGKLVARVDTKVASGQWPVARKEGRGERGEKADRLVASAASAKPQAANPNPRTPNPESPASSPRPPTPSLSTLHSPLFTITTPTAVVTDLGTEFGVEVELNGTTELHVFQGIVEAKTLSSRNKVKNRTLVTAGNTAFIEPNNKITTAVIRDTNRFVRQVFPTRDSRVDDEYRKVVLADKPLGYWPLGEPSGARVFRDLSGNDFHGAAMGTVRAGVAGPLSGQSRAVALDGNSYIDIGRQDGFALSNDFSLEAWVYIDGLDWKENENNNARIFSVGSGEGRHQSTGWTLGYKVKQDSLKPYCVFARYGVGSEKIDGAEIPSARWTHLGLVFDGENTVRLYLDGTERGTKYLGDPALTGPSWAAIGWGANLGGTYWRGRLAHVAVYTKALDKKCFENHFRSICDKKQGVQEH